MPHAHIVVPGSANPRSSSSFPPRTLFSAFFFSCCCFSCHVDKLPAIAEPVADASVPRQHPRGYWQGDREGVPRHLPYAERPPAQGQDAQEAQV
eukprot:4659570-Pleurochrysis_carterae.AAC.1